MFYAMCDESVADTPIEPHRKQATSRVRSAAVQKVLKTPVARAYQSLMSLRHKVPGMHENILASKEVTVDMIVNEYSTFLHAFTKDPHCIMRNVFNDTACDRDVIRTLELLVSALSPVHVICPLKRYPSLPILQGLLMSKHCAACSVLDLTCASCAWSDIGKADNLVQRLVSVLPHAPFDGYRTKQEVAKLISLN